MRLTDFNISHGSHYVSTPNFPDYEEQVQGLLKKFRKDLNVSHDRVVLYGGSKAGTGALVHGVLGDYHAVACDPIINATKYNEDSNRHFVKNFRPADLSSKINGAKKGNRREKVIIANRFVEFNFQNSQKVNGGAIRLIDLNDPTIVKHPRVTPESVPEQLALMNIMLDGHKIIENHRFGLKKLIGKSSSRGFVIFGIFTIAVIKSFASMASIEGCVSPSWTPIFLYSEGYALREAL